MPEDDRTWTLEGKKHQGRMQMGAPVKTCPECYRTVPANSPFCPECGHRFEAAKKKQEDLALELRKVEKSYIKTDYLTVAMCKNYHDLLVYAKSHGYKPGWAYYQAKARGFRTP